MFPHVGVLCAGVEMFESAVRDSYFPWLDSSVAGRRAIARGGVNRGKRLSRSNIIGEEGELLFRRWALKHQLTANKANQDIGIDFFCQVAAPVPGSTSVEGQGPVLGSQVKTVEDGKDARLIIDRVDAIDLLRQTQATCLFGIRLSDESVHFQFVDRNFIDRLVAFLDTENDQLTISYKVLADDSALFLRLLKRYVNPFEQIQLRVHLIQQRVKSGIPGSRFSVDSSGEETRSMVVVPWIPSAFAIDEKTRDQVRIKFLREGTIDPEQEGVELHPLIGEALRETNSSAAVLSGVSAVMTKVKVRLGDAIAVQPFEYREFGTEKNFVHRSGLRITIDRATKELSDGHHHHSLESEIFRPHRPTSLAGTVFNFFRLFRPGATIELQLGWEAPLGTFGESLTSLGEAVNAWPDLCKALKLPMQGLCLGDLHDEEFSRTAWFLEALLIKNLSIGMLANGFLVGPAADESSDQLSTTPVLVNVPIALNWKDVGIVVWLECEADAYLFEGLICGVQLKEQISWQIQKTRRFQKSIYPEVWFVRDWPAVPVREGLSAVMSWNYDGIAKHPFEAKVRRVMEQ